MTSCRATTVPASRLEFGPSDWEAMLAHLRRQGAGVRESGGLLLGKVEEGRRVVREFLPYEQLQADALQEDFVQLSAASFAKVWDRCRQTHLAVVADVHTHRYGAGQSLSDARNPMVALRGHLALIVPNFAQGQLRLDDIGLYAYRGSHRWDRYRGAIVAELISLTKESSS